MSCKLLQFYKQLLEATEHNNNADINLHLLMQKNQYKFGYLIIITRGSAIHKMIAQSTMTNDKYSNDFGQFL